MQDKEKKKKKETIQWQQFSEQNGFMVAKNKGCENWYSIDGQLEAHRHVWEQHQKDTVIKQWRKECSERLYRVIEAKTE